MIAAFARMGQEPSTASPRELTVAVGDWSLMPANNPGKQIVNGAVLAVAGIEAKTGRIHTVEGMTSAFTKWYVKGHNS